MTLDMICRTSHGRVVETASWSPTLGLVRGPTDAADLPGAGVAREHHQLRVDVLLGVALVVLGGGDDPGGIAAVERDSKRASFRFDLAFELDVRWQIVGFVFGAGFDLA